MANEVTLSAALAYASGKLADSIQVSGATFSPSGTGFTRVSQSIATSETALKLGDISSLGYVMIVNRDPTNYVDLKVAASGAIFARLDPDPNSAGVGGVALLKLGSGAQVPVAIANTAACIIDIFIIHA